MRQMWRKLSEDFSKSPITLGNFPIVNKNSKIFTIGSCFAVEVKNYLLDGGYNVLNKEFDANLIWYNTFSILYEFERLIGEFKQDREDIWKLSPHKLSSKDKKRGYNEERLDNKYQDPYRRCIFGKDKNDLWSKIYSIDNIIKQSIRSSDVIVITLGLVEAWFKPDNNRAICAVPGYPRNAGGGQDCYYEFVDYRRNYDNIDKAVNILSFINPQAKVIITTSPIPLAKTFEEVDVLVANTEGKSILRAVCGAISRKYDHVFYYPSYEMVISSNRSRVYTDDGRHVKKDCVASIMSHFEDHFVE